MRCENCGETFAPEDVVYHTEKHGFADGFAEKFACCPFCGSSDLIETEACDVCGKKFPDGDIESGYCLDCLWEAIDYDVALAYMKFNNYLTEFILEEWFGAVIYDMEVSDKLRAFLEETFLRLVANDKLLSNGKGGEFLNKCRDYCLPYYGIHEFGADGQEFAEWYRNRQRGRQNGSTQN